MAGKRRTALILGASTRQSSESLKDYFSLTKNATLFDSNLKGALSAFLIADGPFSEEKKFIVIRFSDPTTHHYVKKYDGVIVVHLGPLHVPTGLEKVGIQIENIIGSIVHAIRYLETRQFDVIYIDSCDHPKIVGTAVALALPNLIDTKHNNEDEICIKYFDEFYFGGDSEYQKGLHLGMGQIIAQKLMKSPSLSDFIKTTKSFLDEFSVSIVERTESWLMEKKMSALLSVSRNSQERPVILEIVYNLNPGKKPLVLVGKATPYENSLFPLSDKPELRQFQYRNGMAGASCIVGALYTLCKLQENIRVHCILAVVWNELCDKPNKRRDVVSAMNGTLIRIDRPEIEGRLVMADALCLADELDFCAVVDVTTLSSNIDGLIGNSYVGFFTSHEHLKQVLHRASASSGEKVWQLPLFKCFQKLLKSCPDAVSNAGEDAKCATACKSAAFLREFVGDTKPWIHLDISAVCESRGRRNYLKDWATGRSTRLVTEFCLNFFKEFKT